MSESNSVLVVIPCYNRGIYLKDTVDSLVSQTYSNFKVILSDNSEMGNDEVLNLFNSINDTRFSYRRSGFGKSAIEHAKIIEEYIQKSFCSYFSVIHDDDYVAHSHLSSAIKIFNLSASFSAVASPLYRVKNGEVGLKRYGLNLYSNRVAKGALACFLTCWRNPIAYSGVIYRKNFLYTPARSYSDDSLGYFDFSFNIEMILKRGVYFKNEATLYYRIHDTQDSKNYENDSLFLTKKARAVSIEKNLSNKFLKKSILFFYDFLDIVFIFYRKLK